MQQLFDLQLPFPQFACTFVCVLDSDEVSVGEEGVGRGEKEGFGFPDSG